MFRLHLLCGFLSAMFLVISYLLAKKGNKAYMEWANKYQTQKISFFGDFINSIEGAKTTFLFKRQKKEEMRFNKKQGDLSKSLIKAKVMDYIYFFLGIDGIQIIYRLLIISVAILAVYNKELIFSKAIIIIYYSELIGNPILELLFALDDIRDSIACIEVIRYEFPDEKVSGKIKINEINTIEYRNINYKTDSGEILFKDFNCMLNKGEKWSICATSGKGKSTLIRMLLGFINDYTGDIFINGVSINEIDREHLMKKMGVQMQNSYIFDTSVMDNICMGNKIDKNEVYLLAECMDIKNKLECEDISVLSGGEKNRILFLRTLVQSVDKEVVIFDEPLEGVEQALVNRIIKAINYKLEGKLLIVVTHNKNVAECFGTSDIVL